MNEATFEVWWNTSGPNGGRREGSVGIAKAAWDAAVAAERERCAALVEGYAALNAENELVRPGLGEWIGERYVPDAEAIAKAIREGK